jgi:hypothetical protein
LFLPESLRGTSFNGRVDFLTETGLAGFGMIPFSRDAGIFGRMITPSGFPGTCKMNPKKPLVRRG